MFRMKAKLHFEAKRKPEIFLTKRKQTGKLFLSCQTVFHHSVHAWHWQNMLANADNLPAQMGLRDCSDLNQTSEIRAQK